MPLTAIQIMTLKAVDKRKKFQMGWVVFCLQDDVPYEFQSGFLQHKIKNQPELVFYFMLQS